MHFNHIAMDDDNSECEFSNGSSSQKKSFLTVVIVIALFHDLDVSDDDSFPDLSHTHDHSKSSKPSPPNENEAFSYKGRCSLKKKPVSVNTHVKVIGGTYVGENGPIVGDTDCYWKVKLTRSNETKRVWKSNVQKID